MKAVETAVGKLRGKEEKKLAEKVLAGIDQTLRADSISDELNGYVKKLSWYLDSFTVR